MENKNVELVETGLRCDNPKCDWKDTSINFDNYEKWINKPCPKCGENVLTREDYVRAEAVRLVAKLINSYSSEELESLNKKFTEEDFEEMKKDSIFEGAKGMENLNNSKFVSMEMQTHNEIKVVQIKPIEEGE